MAALMPHTCEYPALPTYILTCLQDQRQTGRMCDVNIKVGSSSFPAHRCVLCACSGYFKALFTDSDASSVELRLVTEKGVSVLLDYMYTARLQLTAGVAQEVMLAAVYLQVTDIMEDCTAYLGRTFQQSQLAGQRSTVSMATVSQHGRQDSSDRDNNFSEEEGESQRRIHVHQSGEPSRRRVSRDTSKDAVNHMVQGGSRLDRVHDGRSNSSNHKAVSKANVGNRLKGVHDGRASLTNHTSALSSEVGSRQEGVHDGRASSTNQMPALQLEVGNRPAGVHDGRASSTNHISGSQSTVGYKLEEVSDGTEEEVNKTVCIQSSQDNSMDVLSSSPVIVKQEPAENDANLSSEIQNSSSIVEHQLYSEFPDCTFGSSAESRSLAVTAESSSHSVDRINTIANTLFQQQQEFYKDGANSQHNQSNAVFQPGNQNIQTFATGAYGPLNSLQGLFPMPSDPLIPVDLWPVTSDTRSAGIDTSFYSRPQNKHVCVKCGAAFKYASSLRAHKLYKHSNARPFICSTCGYSFKDKSMLKRHSRVHKKWPQTCSSLPTQVGIAAVDKTSCAADNMPVPSSVCTTPTTLTGTGNTSVEGSCTSASWSEDSPQVQRHSDVSMMSDQSSIDGTEAPTLWTTTEGGSLLQAGLQGHQNNRKEEDDANTCDRTAPPALSPGNAARQSTGNETISQVNMFATMLPRSTSMLLTSEGQSDIQGRTLESSMMRGGGDLGDSNPRSHQQTTLRCGQAVVTCPSALQHQGSVGNTTVSYSNAGSFTSIPGASTSIQSMSSLSVMADGASPSQHHPVAMETSAGTSPKVFCCTECSAVFKYDSSLRAHKLYKHSNARPFVCQDCGYAFKAKGMLLRHRRSQHPKPDGL
ncbi:zinc finger and BTB domain-containing protein 18.2-like [Branchiostoma lanceolatum]|uniref:zinc finger and BTB domain-containing protein 18.2-like n=1 Tax=Branchiostoma lanceolatum TaxID=7740 RepID=UPI003451F03D